MAWTFIANRGTNTTKTSGTTLTVNPTATIAAGRILIVRCASDDTTGNGPTHAVSDSAGNTYEQLSFSSGSSDAGSTTISVHISKLTTQLTTASTVTLTLGAARNTKVIELTEFSVASGFTYALGGQASTGGSSTTPAVTLSGLSSIARLWVGLVGAEGLSGDTFTEDVDYSNTITAGTTGNPTASNIKASGGNRIATQSGDAYNPTITNRDWRIILVAITETAVAGATFEASVSGTATTASALTTSITMLASVSGTATADAALTTVSGEITASINAQANAVANLTIGSDLIFGAMSDYLENQIIKHMFRTGSYTKPTELWVSLHPVTLNEDGTGTEVAGNNYSRVQLNPSDTNWAAVGAGGTDALTSNSVALSYPTPTGSWGQITHAGIWDASSGGNLLFTCELSSPYTVNSGSDAPRIVPGGLQININVPPLTDFIPLAASISSSATATGELVQIYFSDGFESGSYNIGTTWSFDKNTNTAVNTNRPHPPSTYSSEYHFNMVGVGDHNLWQQKVITPAKSEFYFRAYIYVTTPVSGPATATIQRKFLRFSDSTSGGTELVNWVASLTSFQLSGGTTMPLAFSAQAEVDSNIGTLNFDQWHCLEMYVVLNTPGSSNGTIRLYVDGTQTFERTNRNIRGAFVNNAASFIIGAQVNHTTSTTTEEFRYIDDVVVSNDYIGL